MKMIDLTGQRFGLLTVLERDYSRKNGTYWWCQCDCGNKISVRKDQLTRKNNPKRCCGCDIKRRNSKAHLKDETGKTYGYLTVLHRTTDLRPGEARWHCKCKCGNEVDVSGVHLRNGSVQSCGCKRYESHNGIDETGNVYGHLTVLERDYSRTDGSHIFWKCKCDCGNTCSINGTYLRGGVSTHCGCRRSIGEDTIRKFLDDNNIQYIKEYTFPDLLGNTNRLRFDFAVFINNQLHCLIEYDGIQHFKENCFNQTKEQFELQQLYDKKKDEYCRQNGFYLIRYNKDNLNTLCLEDILYKGGDEE